MAEDRIRKVWQKALNATIPDIAYDSQGNIYVVTAAGQLIKMSGTGTVLQRKQLENPLFSVAVDPSSGMVTVGDAQNNAYGFNSNLELQWAKNLGEGSMPAVNIVSSINGNSPDDNGDINLSDTYYSQEELDEKMATFGKVKTVNGNMPNDAGNVTLDLGNYYVFSGYINTEDDLDKATGSGWYVTKAPLDFGTLGTVVTYHAEPNSSQIFLGLDNTMWYRSFSANTWGSWVKVTNDVKTINGKAPDANGNIDVEAKGAVTSINGVTPDENGEVQIAAGSEGAVKSINKAYKPDKNTGNVSVPVYAPNLMDGTSSDPEEMYLKGTSNVNLLQDTSLKADEPTTLISAPVIMRQPTTYNLILRLQNTNSVHITVEGYDGDPTAVGASPIHTYDLGTYDKLVDKPVNDEKADYQSISKSFSVGDEYKDINYFAVKVDNTVATNGENLVANSHQVFTGYQSSSPTAWFKLGDMKLAEPLSKKKKYRIWYRVKYNTSYMNDGGGFIEAYGSSKDTFAPNGIGKGYQVDQFDKIAPTRYIKPPKTVTEKYFVTDNSNLDDNQVLAKASPESSDKIYPNTTATWETAGTLEYSSQINHIELWEHNLALDEGDTIEVWLKIAEEDTSSENMGWSPAKGEVGYYAPMLCEQLQLYDKEEAKEIYSVSNVSNFPEDATSITNTNKYRISVLIDATQSTKGSFELALNGDTIDPINSQAVIGGTKGTAYIDIDFNGPEKNLSIGIRATGISYADANPDIGYVVIHYSSLKISHWPSPDDPPDTTWLPSVDDIYNEISSVRNKAYGAVKYINGKGPDSNGMITVPQYQPNLITANTKDAKTMTNNTIAWTEYVPVSLLKSGDDIYASIHIDNNSVPIDGDVTLQFMDSYGSAGKPISNQTLKPVSKNTTSGYASAVWHSPLSSEPNMQTTYALGIHSVLCLEVYLMLSGTPYKTTYKDLVVRTKSSNTNTLNTEWSPSTKQLNSKEETIINGNIDNLKDSATSVSKKVNSLTVDGNAPDVKGNMVSAPYAENLLRTPDDPDAWEEYPPEGYSLSSDTIYEPTSYVFTAELKVDARAESPVYLSYIGGKTASLSVDSTFGNIGPVSKGATGMLSIKLDTPSDLGSVPTRIPILIQLRKTNNNTIAGPVSGAVGISIRHYQLQKFPKGTAIPDLRYKPNSAYSQANDALSKAKEYTDSRLISIKNSIAKIVICSQSTYSAMPSHDPNTVYFLTS